MRLFHKRQKNDPDGFLPPRVGANVAEQIQGYSQWLNKTLDKCLEDEQDNECNYKKGTAKPWSTLQIVRSCPNGIVPVIGQGHLFQWEVLRDICLDKVIYIVLNAIYNLEFHQMKSIGRWIHGCYSKEVMLLQLLLAFNVRNA